MTTFLTLMLEFFKTGLFSVGGGLATIPFLRDIAERTKWFTLEELADMIAISEATPGPIGVNMATYVGYTVAGILGGICATLALVLPAFLIIVVLYKFIQKFRYNKYFIGVFNGLRPATAGLIAGAVAGVFWITFINQENLTDSNYFLDFIHIEALVLYALLLLLLRFFGKKMHPAYFLLIGAACGIIFRM